MCGEVLIADDKEDNTDEILAVLSRGGICSSSPSELELPTLSGLGDCGVSLASCGEGDRLRDFMTALGAKVSASR